MLLLDGNLVDADRPHLRLGPHYRVRVGLTYEHVFDPTHDHLILHVRRVHSLHWHFRPNGLLKIARDVQMEQERLRRVHNAGAMQLFRQKGVSDGLLPQLGLTGGCKSCAIF